MDSWNAIGKHWLQKYDNKFGGFFFFVSAPILKIQISHPLQNIQAWIICWGHVLRSIKVTFQIKTYLVTQISNFIESIFYQSFLKNNIFKTNDIQVKNNKTCVENQTVFNR